MKTVSILFSFLMLTSFMLNAQQWTGATNQTGDLNRTGNVGIGTNSLDGKLTVGGNVNIGGTGSGTLKVRHIDGKQGNNAGDGPIYLNHSNERNVYVGSNGKRSNLYVYGNMYLDEGWLRIRGKRGVIFETYGGGIYMQDATWIRTYGNKSFYHNGPVLRTDAMLQVGPDGSRLRVNSNGNTGIGTTTPNYKLDVNGIMRAKEVRVETGWSDHVFLPEYVLPTLKEEERFIQQNGHLLGFESEKAMGGEVKLADVTNRQQEAIEKLMLHVIELEKKIEQLEGERKD